MAASELRRFCPNLVFYPLFLDQLPTQFSDARSRIDDYHGAVIQAYLKAGCIASVFFCITPRSGYGAAASPNTYFHVEQSI